MVICANDSYKYEWPMKDHQNGLSVSEDGDHGDTGLTGGSAVVKNTGYSEETFKEGKGRNRLSRFCLSEISEVQSSLCLLHYTSASDFKISIILYLIKEVI